MMKPVFTIEIKSTCIRVYPGLQAADLLQPLLDLLTYEDEYVEETKTLGYIYDEQEDMLYLHKGVDVNYVRRLLGEAEIVQIPYDEPKPMKFVYDEIVSPRNDEQVDVINFIAGLEHHASNIDTRQLFLVKNPGFG